MPQEQHITLTFVDGGDGRIQISHRRDVIIINIFRAVFALGLFVLKAAAFDQDQQQPLQLLTRVIGAAFFSILSIVPLRQPRSRRRKGNDDPPSNMLDNSQSSVGRQLILSRKSRLLALYLILWWYACRAVPSIQSRVAASPVANAAYKHFFEKMGNIICQNERLHIQSMEEKMKRKIKSMQQDKKIALEILEKNMRTVTTAVGKARDELEKQMIETKQKHREELEYFKENESEFRRQIEAMQSEAEDNSRNLKALEEQLAAEIQLRIQEGEWRKQAEEREDLANKNARESSQMLQDATAERDACVAARTRRRWFKRRGGTSTLEDPENTVKIQSALVEIWSIADWLFALF